MLTRCAGVTPLEQSLPVLLSLHVAFIHFMVCIIRTRFTFSKGKRRSVDLQHASSFFRSEIDESTKLDGDAKGNGPKELRRVRTIRVYRDDLPVRPF